MQIPVHRLSFGLFLFMAAHAGAQSVQLLCNDPRGPGVERQLIKDAAADVAQRRSKHRLVIRAGGAMQEFVDQPPHDEPFAGKHHYFCDRKAGLVLVMVIDQDLFTGVLVNEATGKVTPAGEVVWLSQDRRAYLAAEQPNGMDGNRWSVYAIDGRLSWAGYNFIPGAGPDLVAHAYLSDPTWTPRGELTATARCAGDTATQWRVKLVKQAGEWDWQPKRPCGATHAK